MSTFAVRDGSLPESGTPYLDDDNLTSRRNFHHETLSDDSDIVASETDSQQSWHDSFWNEDEYENEDGDLGLFIEDTFEDAYHTTNTEIYTDNTESVTNCKRRIISSPCEYSKIWDIDKHSKQTYDSTPGTFTKAAVVTGQVIRGTLLAPVYAVFGIVCGPILLAREGADSATNISSKILAGTMGAANGLVLGPMAGIAASFMDSFGISEPENERIEEYMMLSQTSRNELTVEGVDDDWLIVNN